MVGDDSSPSATTSLSPSPGWLRDLNSDERGLYLIHLLLNCSAHVAAGDLPSADASLDLTSLLSSPSGDSIQRLAAHFTTALASRLLLRSLPGVHRALHSATTTARSAALARRHFLDLLPFLRLAFSVSNQSILEAMEGEKMIHIVDLNAADPIQWLSLLQSLAARPEGPPHLRITGVHRHRDILLHTGAALSEEAERLDIPFQFNAIVSALDDLDLESLKVKTGEALAVSSVLQLHRLLAPRSNNLNKAPHRASIRKITRMDHETLEDLELDSVHGCSPKTELRAERFLASLWDLSPKVMVVVEQEASHNGTTLTERFTEALNYYAALFDCLESTVSRQSEERVILERVMFGEEIKNIIACDGFERRERHERLQRWGKRLETAGFGAVPLSYYGLLHAKAVLRGFGCEGYEVREENGSFLVCWQDRALFSVSAWRCRRFD